MRVMALMNMGQAGKALGLAGAVATFADLAQPVAPVSTYVLVISLLILTALMVVRFFFSKWNDALSITAYFAVISLVFSIFLMIYQNANPQAKRLGVMGAYIPGIVEMQKSLGMVNKQLAHISKKVDSIDKKISKLKKETSDDPRKELFNMGITWDQASFYKAANRGDLKNFDLFLKGGMNPDPVIVKLFTQQSSNTYKVVEHLIKRKYNINKKHSVWSGQYDLAGMAIIFGDIKIVQLLLKNGADLESAKKTWRQRMLPLSDKINNMCFSLKPTPREKKYYNTVPQRDARKAMLRTCHAIPAGQTGSAKSYYDRLVKIHEILYSKPYQPALMADKVQGMAYAMLANKPDLLERYLKAGGDANARVKDPLLTPLIAFAMESDKPVAMVSLLIKAGADVNAAQKNGDTPLLIFVRNNKPAVISLLLQHKADVNRLNKRKVTPFVAAVLYNNFPVVKDMLKYSPDVNARDSGGVPLLIRLLWNKKPAMLKLLVENGLNPDVKLGGKSGGKGKTVLEEAIDYNNVSVVRVLLKHKAKLVNPDWKHISILESVTSGKKDLKILELLLKHGAKPNYRDSRGYSLLDSVAVAFGYAGVKLMLDHGADPMLKTWDGKPTLERYTHKKKIYQLMKSRVGKGKQL